ncbi:Cytochrome c oxidase subunit NDUFA4 [Frankliniella fusca]|uniref:Cytochrome c oxidase subunit NDUFA4 n=1 Tax=Frankliniella fusca TaxID=407009 RepID=A0AAE1HS75_9NEOP|nr:Cytochrome c oxidase subunit NDUFA4 [Frankliniella fusca]
MSRSFTGTSLESLKKRKELIPVWLCIGVGFLLSSAYTLRLALKNPDVTWNRNSNPEPWQEYETKNYKIINPIERKIGTDAPKF